MAGGTVTPIGGTHRSARSLLAEIMSDDEVVKCVVVVIRKDGNIGHAHYEMSRAEMAYAGTLLGHLAFE